MTNDEFLKMLSFSRLHGVAAWHLPLTGWVVVTDKEAATLSRESLKDLIRHKIFELSDLLITEADRAIVCVQDEKPIWEMKPHESISADDITDA